MSFLQLAYTIARRRIATAWRLELVLFMGILLSVALLSSSVVFSDLLAEAALRRALREAPANEANFWVRIFLNLEEPSIAESRPSVYQTSTEFVDDRVTGVFEPYVEDHARLLETSTFFFTGDPRFSVEQDTRPRGRIQHMTRLFDEDRSVLLEGRWPRDATAAGGDMLEVAVEENGAQMVGLNLGDTLSVHPATGNTETKIIDVRIVGIFERIDPEDDFWFGRDHNFSNHNGEWPTIPMFTTESAILQRVGTEYPGIYSNVTWIYDLDRQGFSFDQVDEIQQSIRNMRYQLVSRLDNSTVSLKLDRLLDEYSEQLILSRIPLYLMVFLVVGILAYYLALVSALTIRSRSAEIAMLKSRGTTTLQVALMIFVEGLLLAIPALIVGTLLAAPVASLLGSLFFDVQRDGIIIALSGRAFLLGAAGALLAVVVLTLATLVAARQGIVEFRQAGARPARAPLLHRYYLDFLLLALIAFIWWQIQSRSSFLLRPVGRGALEIDFTLLLGPVLALLALGLIVLRFFPLAVALLARVIEPIGPVWMVQGMRRVGRDPIAPGSLVVLLMLATALGVIGSAFGSTLERSQEDRARYQVGADVRVQHAGHRLRVSSLGLDQVHTSDIPVLRIAEVSRMTGNLLTQGFSSQRFDLLAVDSSRFAQVAWFRPDFVEGQTLGSLMRSIQTPPGLSSDQQPAELQISRAILPGVGSGIPLPEGTTALSLWANPGQPRARLGIGARIRDGRGYTFDALIGEPGEAGWQKVSGELQPRPTRGGRQPIVVEPPFTLVNLQVFSRFGLSDPGVVFLDDLAAVTPEGEVSIADFQSLDNWQVVEDYTRPGLYALESSEAVGREPGRRSAAYSWAPGGVSLRAIRPGPSDTPLAAIVSPQILEAADARLNDVISVGTSNAAFPVKIVAVAEYFPTLDPRSQPFMVIDQAAFNLYGDRLGRRPGSGPNEVWASAEDEQGAADFLTAVLEDMGVPVESSSTASEEIRQRVEQPLANASWGGLLALMFLALVLASASGVVLFSYVDTGERRTEFALLRTLGSSTTQLNGMVWFNLLLMVVCGVVLGTWAGQQIGATLLPVLEVSEGGVRVTPPMALETNWITLGVAYLALAAVAVSNIVWLAWFTGRLNIQQVLRAGEAG
ncbi:MAG: ABC transporter permease [Chloroflexota bacterium]|nr:ABC transporter permease [Chloroflexota bacterium]